MSIVGPRPLVKYESNLYGDHQKIRNAVKPGITGLAQIPVSYTHLRAHET